VDNHLNP